MLFIQRVESVKKLFLGALFSGNELNIVNQQHTHSVKALAEAEHLVETQRVDHFNRKLFRAHIAQPRRWIPLLDGMPNGTHQVRLAHAYSAVQKQRVVCLGRLLGNRPRRCVRELIRLANHKRIKRVPRVQLMVPALEIQLGLLDRRCCSHCNSRHRLFFGADILYPHCRYAQFVKNGLHDLAVSAREHVAKHGCGNLHVNDIRIGPVQPGWLEPGVKGIDADSGFYALQELVPQVCRFAFFAKLNRRRDLLLYAAVKSSHAKLNTSLHLSSLERAPAQLRGTIDWHRLASWRGC
jgi:hypothetical protein